MHFLGAGRGNTGGMGEGRFMHGAMHKIFPAIPAAWGKAFPNDPNDDLRDIDTFREPCLIEMEKRDFACAGFHIPFEKGWQDCENCNNSLCPYEGRPFSIGDELAWMRELPVSGHNTPAFSLPRVLISGQ